MLRVVTAFGNHDVQTTCVTTKSEFGECMQAMAEYGAARPGYGVDLQLQHPEGPRVVVTRGGAEVEVVPVADVAAATAWFRAQLALRAVDARLDR